MTTEPDRLEALKPCRACGAACRVETFGPGGQLFTEVTLWVCSRTELFGGSCPDGQGYFSPEAWNTRPIETNSRTGDTARSVCEYSYTELFNAIAAATSPYGGGTGVNISVTAFRAALSAPQSITPPEVGGELAAAQRLAEFADTHLRSPGSAKLWEDRTEHNRQYFLAAARVALSTPEVVDGNAGLVEIEADILGAQMVLENRAQAATDCLAKIDWKPSRAHLEGARNAMREALKYLKDARTALSQHRGVSSKGGNDGN